MTVHHARIVALAAVLGVGALGVGPHLHAQSRVTELSLDVLRALAEQGDAEAQVNLGILYHRGEGVPQDDIQASAGIDLPPTRTTPARSTTSGSCL